MQLHRYQKDFDRLRIRTAVITFGSKKQAAAWRQETGVTFPVLLDPERDVYRRYHLERSWRRSWNLRTIWRYIQLLSAGSRWRGIQGDSAQLGADFLLDAFGNLLAAWYSLDPTDRPGVDDLLAHASKGE